MIQALVTDHVYTASITHGACCTVLNEQTALEVEHSRAESSITRTVLVAAVSGARGGCNRADKACKVPIAGRLRVRAVRRLVQPECRMSERS